jgi:hypothetical protein
LSSACRKTSFLMRLWGVLWVAANYTERHGVFRRGIKRGLVVTLWHSMTP